MRGRVEVADIFRAHGPAYRQRHADELSLEQRRAMRAIELCRTAELGGHVDECDHCGALRISYNSCRNRHCPKCQSLDKERWLERQCRDLLPVPYFHLVFTLPEALGPLVLRNQAVLYDCLFRASSEALLELTADEDHLGGQIGATALLHTWSQTLRHHPHVHFIVPGGGLSGDGRRWVAASPSFLVPVKALSRLFRGKMLAAVRGAYAAGELIFPGRIADLEQPRAFRRLLDSLYQQDWVVYCKPPFGGPQQTLEYLARYTHRVAISNERLVDYRDGRVTFRYRDSAAGNRIRETTVTAETFTRRFLLHVLPNRFVRVRHYGLLSNRNRRTKLAHCQQLLGGAPTASEAVPPRQPWQDLVHQLTGTDPRQCRRCGEGHMRTIRTLTPSAERAPPETWRRSA
ncbi:IS91 family transposase [Candidatus Latescibacterota bacterium]